MERLFTQTTLWVHAPPAHCWSLPLLQHYGPQPLFQQVVRIQRLRKPPDIKGFGFVLNTVWRHPDWNEQYTYPELLSKPVENTMEALNRPHLALLMFGFRNFKNALLDFYAVYLIFDFCGNSFFFWRVNVKWFEEAFWERHFLTCFLLPQEQTNSESVLLRNCSMLWLRGTVFLIHGKLNEIILRIISISDLWNLERPPVFFSDSL